MSFTDAPVITTPFDAPLFHYELDDEGQPTGKKLDGRRESIQIVPLPAARRRGPKQLQLGLDDEGGVSVTRNSLVNEIRKHVDQWRNLPLEPMGRQRQKRNACCSTGATPRGRGGLFFCQREAVETLIYLTEVAPAAVPQADRGCKRRSQSRPLSACLQDGDRLRQDHRHGHDHCLALR